MKSARIIAQEIAEILKGDVVAAMQVKDHFAEGELMTLLGLTDTVAAARIAELEEEEEARLYEDIAALRSEIQHANARYADSRR